MIATGSTKITHDDVIITIVIDIADDRTVTGWANRIGGIRQSNSHRRRIKRSRCAIIQIVFIGTTDVRHHQIEITILIQIIEYNDARAVGFYTYRSSYRIYKWSCRTIVNIKFIYLPEVSGNHIKITIVIDVAKG